VPLVQGGDVEVASNPTTAAMAKMIAMENPYCNRKEAAPSVYKNILVLSIGTGTKLKKNYTVADCNKWNILNWLTKDGSSPLIDIFFNASADMVDINAQVLF
jgi:hypothetical protein